MSTVGEVIGRHHDEILHLWKVGADRAALAEGQSPPALVSMMPAYLSSLGQCSADEPVHLSGAQQEMIEHHLSDRLRQPMVLKEVVAELAILGRCVSRILDGEPVPDRPAVGDVARLFAELYAAVTAVTRIFNEHMLEDQRAEQRYDRLLQRIASEALSPHLPAVPVRERLNEAMAVIRAAMGAQTAALLLFEAQSDQPVMCVSIGVAAGLLERHLLSLDASALAEKTGPADGQTALVDDAETTELAASEALREAGVGSLLRVRLAPGHLLRSAVHIGIAEQRPFTASEIRRAEGLSRILTMYLDNAQLRAALAEKEQAITVEGELRERFVSVLMHDLTGPLEAAKANAQGLCDPCTLDDPELVAADVVRDLERMEWMVRGLLDVHRIRAGQRLPLHLADCDLGAIAREAVDELRASHGDRFSLRVDRGVRGVWSAELLRRAIWNLSVNGIEHGAVGRPIVISVTGSPAGAAVTVHNEGSEIPAEIQAELFHPFSLPGSAIHGPRSGWGLGLTFVWGCVEAHGGGIVAESRAGSGTTFRMLIPYDARPYAD